MTNVNEHENNDDTGKNILLDNAHNNNHHHMNQKRPDLKHMCKKKAHVQNNKLCLANRVVVFLTLATHRLSSNIGKKSRTQNHEKNVLDVFVKWVRGST